MANIHEDSDWDVAEPTGQPRWIQPFPESNEKIVFEQDYTQRAETWLESPVPLGTANADDPTFYLVSEGTPQDLGGGMYKFTRTWAQIPAARTDYESFAFTFPGIATGVSYTANTVTGNTATTSAGVTTMTISGGSAIAVGDSVRIRYNAFTETEQFTRTIIRTALTGTGGGTLKVAQIVDTAQAQPLYYFTAQKIELGRDPITETVASILTYDYFMLGVSAGINSFSDIPLVVKSIIIDGDGLQLQRHHYTGNL
jgi:hypothetical protein